MALADILKPRVTELGKIKIGGKAEQGRQSRSGGTFHAPEKWDHFIVTTGVRGKDGPQNYIPDAILMESLAEYADRHDGKLRQLPIALLSNDLDEVMQTAYVAYVGKKLAARSDGLKLEKFYDFKTKAFLPEPKVVDWKPEYADQIVDGKPLFKLHSVFSCVIAAGEARWGGVYKFRTTSKITADQLYGTLVHIKGLTGGILRGLPLRMVVRPKQVQPDGRTSTVYVVHCELVGRDLQQVQERALERAKYEVENRRAIDHAQREYRQLLALPGHESDDEHAHLAAEFHVSTEAPTPPAEPDPLAERLGLKRQQPTLEDDIAAAEAREEG